MLAVRRVAIPPHRAWRDADEALEGPAERGLGLVAEATPQIDERRLVILEPGQRDMHSPPRHIVHRRLADEFREARDGKGVVVRELLGPRDLSYSEVTRILGERIGKPDLQYVQFSYADEAKALVQAGLSESFASLYVEMTRAFNEEKIKPRAGRTSDNTTPARFEDFAHELARAYETA